MRRHLRHRLWRVAGENPALDAHRGEGSDRAPRVDVLHGLERDEAHEGTIPRDEDDRATALPLRIHWHREDASVDALLVEPDGTPHEEHVPVDDAPQPGSGHGLDLARLRGIDALPVRERHRGCGEGVLAVDLDAGNGGDQRRQVVPVGPTGLCAHGVDSDAAHAPGAGERAGLVEHDRAHVRRALDGTAAFDQDPLPRGAARADHDGDRCRETQRARAGDDQDGDGGTDADVGCSRTEPPAKERHRGNHQHDRHEHAGDAVGHARDGRRLRLGTFDPGSDAAQRRVATDRRHLDLERAGAVGRAGDDRVTRLAQHAIRLARQEALVHATRPRTHRAVRGKASPGSDHHAIADEQAAHGDLARFGSLPIDDEGRFRLETHQVIDRAARRATRACFEPASEAHEHHDHGARVEVERPVDHADEGAYRGSERDEGAEGDQDIHVRAAVTYGLRSTREDRPAGTEHDEACEHRLDDAVRPRRGDPRRHGGEHQVAGQRGGQVEARAPGTLGLHQPARPRIVFGLEHGAVRQRRAQRLDDRRRIDVAYEPATILLAHREHAVEALYALDIGAGGQHRRTVAELVAAALQAGVQRGEAHVAFDAGAVRAEVHRDPRHALGALQQRLDALDAACAVHPFDRNVAHGASGAGGVGRHGISLRRGSRTRPPSAVPSAA